MTSTHDREVCGNRLDCTACLIPGCLLRRQKDSVQRAAEEVWRPRWLTDNVATISHKPAITNASHAPCCDKIDDICPLRTPTSSTFPLPLPRKVKCAIIPHEEWSAHLPYLGREPAGGWTTEVCDAWPVTSPSQPQSITAPWPVPNYTAWWQRHMCVNNLPNVVTWKQIAAESNPRPFESRVHRHNHYTNFNPPPKKNKNYHRGHMPLDPVSSLT